MELVITLLIVVLAIQSVYMYFIAKKQNEMKDLHNNVIEATIIFIEDIATAIEDLETAIDDIEQHMKETQ